MLLEQLRASFREVQETAPEEDGFTRTDGAYYEIDLRSGAKPEKLEKKKLGITLGATKPEEGNAQLSAVVFIPDESIGAVEGILEEYRSGPLTEKRQEPPRKDFVEPIERIRRARLYAFWTDDPKALPEEGQAQIWWEVWCAPESEAGIVTALEAMNCQIADKESWLAFPESTVIPVLARRADIELATIVCKGLQELRRGSDTPNFFLEEERENQADWANDLAERVTWPGGNVPRVCLLDTGVNRAHVLIEPALSENDLLTANPDWVKTDNVNGSHGTEMAGLALFGDLEPHLHSTQTYELRHRLESVRILPADGFPRNEPARLSSITLAAVSLAEIQNPASDRVFCMAVTNEDRSGDRASSWSACIDRASIGMEIVEGEGRQYRLFCVSGGNIPSKMNAQEIADHTQFPIKDPAQGWNALTIGGYTDKILIDPQDKAFEGYTPLVEAGDLSPYSRNSLAWRRGKTPIKPEVLFEAGNRARSANGQGLMDCPSLELLTTGAEVNRLPIVNFAATSAATAQAARLLARLRADHPNLWPETLRALTVHSASWTTAMMADFDSAGGLRQAQNLVRMFGYGVPSYERATRSASSDLALITEQKIQPYRLEKNGAVLNECHYYELPWPRQILEEYTEEIFTLKVTLSYFIKPNPGKSAAIDPQRYQSFGLRFDLKRPNETTGQYKSYINKQERGDHYSAGRAPDGGWTLGSSSISAGSLHCDIWSGNGAQLASRNMICVYPVSGWWKERRNRDVCEQEARYALVLTLKGPNTDIDLHTPISAEISAEIDISTEIE